MSKVLFLHQPCTGHMNVLLSIALQMRDEGHRVYFLIPGTKMNIVPNFEILKTGAHIPKVIEGQGIPADVIFPPLLMMLKAIRLPFTYGYKEFALVVDMFSQGAVYYTKKILKHIKSIYPDVLVTDYTFFPSYFAAELRNIPCVVMYPSGLPFKGKLIPPFGSGLPIGKNYEELGRKYVQGEQALMKRLDNRVNSAREKLGLPPCQSGSLRRPYSKWLNLVASVEAIEIPRENLPSNVFYIGPCFVKQKNISTKRFPFDILKNEKYKIYVCFETEFNNKPEVFRKIMSGLDHPDYQVIISAGSFYQILTQGRKPENVMLFQTAPLIDLLPQVDLVIGDGGKNSINETLAAGKPLIVMPIGGEQGDNASQVEYLKAGLKLNITGFSEEELKQTVNQIRYNQEFMDRAMLLKQAIDQTDGSATASECIHWIAHHNRPLYRPKSFPLTIPKGGFQSLISGTNI